MRIRPNRLESYFLVLPLWHPLVLAIVTGATAGLIAETTSFHRFFIWLVAALSAWSVLALDVVLHRYIGWRHEPGEWSRYRTDR